MKSKQRFHLTTVIVGSLMLSRICVSAGSLFFSSGTDVAIPDGTGMYVHSPIKVSGAPSGATVTRIDWFMSVHHNDGRDLDVDLNDHTRTAAFKADLWKGTFLSGGTASGVNPVRQGTITSGPLIGLPVNQIWYLAAADVAGGDAGYIDAWNMTIYWADVTTYPISVSASPSAGGTVSGGGTFAGGSSRTVTAAANSGYTFVNWTQNGSVVSTSPSYTFTLTSSRTLVANFTQNTVNYTISLSASPSADGTVSGGGTFSSGSSRTVTATANSGYTFANWTQNGSVVSTSPSYTFTLTSSRTLVANFTKSTVNYTISLSTSPSAGGTVSGSGTFASGSSRTVTAMANIGYTFANWTQNGSVVISSASYTFTLTSSRTLVANFTPTGIVKAQMTSPVNGSTFSSSSVTFNWSAGGGVGRYFLYVGSSAGDNNIYAADQGTSLSRTVSGIPTDGRTVYVRLWSYFSSGWQYNDYNYEAFTGTSTAKAQMTSPANGSTFSSSSVLFNWNAGSGAGRYFLYVGNSTGANDLYAADQGTSLSSTVSGIPTDGRTIRVRLWSYFSSGWQYNDYNYKAAPSSSLYWPLSGSVTSLTGDIETTRSGHKGTDIASAANYAGPRPSDTWDLGWTLNGEPTASLYSGGDVYAAAPGKVAFVSLRSHSAGRYVVIDHGCGYKTRYLHLYAVNVTDGQEVTTSTKIGIEGNTGQVEGVTGCHLHFEFFRDASGGTANYPDAGEWRSSPVSYSAVQRGSTIPSWSISCP